MMTTQWNTCAYFNFPKIDCPYPITPVIVDTNLIIHMDSKAGTPRLYDRIIKFVREACLVEKDAEVIMEKFLKHDSHIDKTTLSLSIIIHDPIKRSVSFSNHGSSYVISVWRRCPEENMQFKLVREIEGFQSGEVKVEVGDVLITGTKSLFEYFSKELIIENLQMKPHFSTDEPATNKKIAVGEIGHQVRRTIPRDFVGSFSISFLYYILNDHVFAF